MLIPAPCLAPAALVGVTWGVPYGVSAGVSSDLADNEVELGFTLGLTLGLLPEFLSLSDILAVAHLLGLKHPCEIASGSWRLVGLLTGDAADGIGALIMFDR